MLKAFSAATLAVVLAGSSSALAVDVSVGNYLRFNDGPGTTTSERPGGEFIVQVLQSNQSFRTFCLERMEAMYFGSASFSVSGGDPTRTHPFQVDGISERAMLGGPDLAEPAVAGDPISSRTAFLYQNFVLGTLDGYAYSADNDPARIRSADALQNAIWFLEDEIDDAFFGITDAETQALITHFLNLDMGDFEGTGLVQVLNLSYRWDGPGGVAGGHGQDVLVLIPLPQTAGLGLVGLLGVVGATSRRRR